MAGKNRYNVRIGNDNYVLKTERSKEETDQIVKYVDTEIESARKQLKYRNQTMHVTLACLNIADTLYSISHDYDDYKKEAQEPMREYWKLKEKHEDIKEKASNHFRLAETLKNQVASLEKELENLKEEREIYKLELEDLRSRVEADKKEVGQLKDKLIEEEKKTLGVYKQLQEVMNRSGN